MSASDTDIKNKKLTRRGFIKWTTALAVVGAAAVGIGAGYGSDLLLRPSTEKTTTETTTKTTSLPGQTGTTTKTTTVTAPVQTLSYVPPLSPSVQNTVDQIIQNRVAMHQGETIAYAGITGGSIGMGVAAGVYKLHVKNGVITTIETDDTWNTGVAVDDAGLSTADLMKSHLQARIKANGYTWHMYNQAPDRILFPMKRVGTRADPLGQFVRTTWQDALDTLANTVTTVKQKYGPYSSYGGPLSSYTGIGVNGWGDVSWGGEDIASQWILGASKSTQIPKFPAPKGGVNTTGNLLDIFNSKSIILWGHDPTTAGDTSPRQNGRDQHLYRLARERGIPVIVVDIRYGMHAEVLADQWIPIRPGTDLAAFLAIANVLFKENLYNTDFVAKYVEPTGFQKWKDYVLGVSDGIDKTPQWAEPITGIPAATLKGLAEFLAANVPCHFVPAAAIGRQRQGDRPVRAAFIINAMVGNFGIPGGAPPYCEYGHWNTGVPSPDYGRAPGTYNPPVLYKGYEWADAILLKPQLDSGQITQAQYDAIIGKTPGDPNPNIKLIFTALSNDINQALDINKQRDAIKLTDLFAAASFHWTPTAKLADLVLPLAEVFETYWGFSGIANGMIYCTKVVEPPGEAMPLEWVYTQLAKRLGFVDKYMPNYTTDDQWDTMVQAAMQKGYEAWAKSASVKALGITIPSWADFVKLPVIRAETPQPIAQPLQDQMTSGKPFGTPSGKIEFYYSYVDSIDPSKTAVGGPWPGLPIYETQPQGYYDSNLSKYPLVLRDTHNRYRSHSAQDSDAMLHDLFRHSVWINPADAKARNIKDNDTVRVFNDTGQMLVPAYVTSRILPGVVYMWDAGWYDPNSAGFDKGGCPNTVMPRAFNAHAQDPHNVLVEVTKF